MKLCNNIGVRLITCLENTSRISGNIFFDMKTFPFKSKFRGLHVVSKHLNQTLLHSDVTQVTTMGICLCIRAQNWNLFLRNFESFRSFLKMFENTHK